MSDNRTATQKRADELRFATMSSDRPLDALLPELTSQEPPLPKEILHPRVLELGPSEGDAWVMAMWSDPGTPQEIHKQVRRLLEATLLANLSRAAETGEELDRAPSTIRLLVFSTTRSNVADALKAFGFRLDNSVPFQGDQLAALQREGRQTGWDVPAQPVSTWTASLTQPSSNGREDLVSIHRKLRELINDDCWGNTPGAFSRCAANLIHKELKLEIEPTIQGLNDLEDLVVQRDTLGSVRWIPAMLFQALADFVGVVIQQVYKHKVEWALCEPEENGFAPPPLLRITRDDGTEEHLAIGLHLLRWCIMPILPGEEVPRLSAWLDSEFENATRH